MSAVIAVSSLMRRFADVRLLIGAGALFLVSAAALFASSLSFSIGHVTARCGQEPPDVRFYSSADDLRDFLAGCGAAGREAYQNLQIADLFYPAIFAVFLASALALTLSRVSRPGSPVVALAAAPLIASAFDYLENAAAWVALAVYPADPGTAAELMGIASLAKQALSWASWLLLVGAVGLMTVRLVQHRRWRREAANSAPSGAR
ncbi:hypothetical protein ACVBEQ_07705 [Nakamurella sp. GG22]